MREFVAQHQLEPRGISFFRQKWDKDVSDIYKDVLGAFPLSLSSRRSHRRTVQL